jgi:hypothetical protein
MGTGYDAYPAGQQDSPYMPVGLQQQQQQPPQHTQYRQQPTGARLKVMRCVQLKAPESKRALIDFGLGVGVDLDRQVRMLHSTMFCQLKRRTVPASPSVIIGTGLKLVLHSLRGWPVCLPACLLRCVMRHCFPRCILHLFPRAAAVLLLCCRSSMVLRG